MIKIFDLSINKYRTICAALIIALICPLLSGCTDALSFDKSGETSRISLDENVPFLMYGKKIKPKNLGTRKTFADMGATVLDYLSVESTIEGKSVL